MVVVPLLGVCSTVLLVLINITSAQNQCTTPDNRKGNCIALPRCEPLFRHIRGGGDITAQQRSFLRNSQCGGDSRNPLVCCPTNTFTIDDLPSGKQCGVQVENKIVGGERAAITDYPWHALLHYTRPNGREGFDCGGSIINENYVLTAAHCIRGPHIKRTRSVLDFVRLGENDLRSEPDCQEGVCADPVQNFGIGETIVHENYHSATQGDDIALIRLQRPASFSNYTIPICLPIRDLKDRNYDGSPLTVAGFGRTEEGTPSPVKMKVEINGFNWANCSSTYRSLGDKMMCAGGEEGIDSCKGDSGGALVAKETSNSGSFFYLVGVVSFGPGTCGTLGLPGIYTRADKYTDWIVDHMTK